MELSRRTPVFLLGLILLAFTTHGLYHSLGAYYKDLSQTPQQLDKIMQNHPIFLAQITLFTLVIMGAWLVPKLPPHGKLKERRSHLTGARYGRRVIRTMLPGRKPERHGCDCRCEEHIVDSVILNTSSRFEREAHVRRGSDQYMLDGRFILGK